MAFSRVTGTSVTVGSGGSTSAINTTGSSALFAFISWLNIFGDNPTLTDSKSNTWTLVQTKSQSSWSIKLYACYSPTVGSGHTFTVSTGSGFQNAVIAIEAWSGSAASPADASGSNVISNSTGVPSAAVFTPTQNNELILTAVVPNNSITVNSIDSGFTFTTNFTGAAPAIGICIAYLIQGIAASVNPLFTFSSSMQTPAIINSFKVGSAPPAATVKQLASLGVG